MDTTRKDIGTVHPVADVRLLAGLVVHRTEWRLKECTTNTLYHTRIKMTLIMSSNTIPHLRETGRNIRLKYPIVKTGNNKNDNLNHVSSRQFPNNIPQLSQFLHMNFS
jgi:hypothetical protein